MSLVKVIVRYIPANKKTEFFQKREWNEKSGT